MSDINDPPPAEIAADLVELRNELDRTIPAKALDKNLLIATWNIRNFGSLTEKWISGPKDSPRRDYHAVRCIAEIISRFDVIALQEVRSNLKALRYTLKVLPAHWGLILTDATRGALGNQERMAFLFDTRKVLLSGLACELVIPPEQLEQIEDDNLRRQFSRTPYAVGFRCLDKYFTLVSLHIIWGSSAQERLKELKAIANWLEDWTKDKYAWDHNLIALGDFNIEQVDDPLFQAFTSTGLGVSEELRKATRSIFDTPGKVEKYFDQIAWFQGEGKGKPLELDYVSAGNFDFTKAGMNSRKMDLETLSWFLSDHLPLWVEFSVRT
jgi:endonuclease/exonuclease/phosphatase family metal-dependent hydrolase